MTTQCLDQTYTVSQATDLAKYFLGPDWKASSSNGACILMRGNMTHSIIANTSWRDVFRSGGVKLPVRREFVAIDTSVMQDDEHAASCRSRTMALRTANALNRYRPGSRGY